MFVFLRKQINILNQTIFLNKYQYKSGESVNPTRRPKDSLNKKTAREYLAFLQEEVNQLTRIKGLLSNEDI